MLGMDDLLYLVLDECLNIVAAFAYKCDADEFVSTIANGTVVEREE